MSKRSNTPRFKICVICGNRYERGKNLSNAAWDRRNTCGRTCGAKYHGHNRRRTIRFCKQCRVTELLWYQSIFCSQSCREIWGDENEYNAPPEIMQEWPGWMAIEKPFAAHDCDPGDGNVVRMHSPDPHRLGISLYGSSADWAVSYGNKAGPWERGEKK